MRQHQTKFWKSSDHRLVSIAGTSIVKIAVKSELLSLARSLKGGLPVANSYAKHPKAHTSTSFEQQTPYAISGENQLAVPLSEFRNICCSCRKTERPRSAILIVPSGLHKMFSDFMSRCNTLLSCITFRPLATIKSEYLQKASEQTSELFMTMWARSPPSINSKNTQILLSYSNTSSQVTM